MNLIILCATQAPAIIMVDAVNYVFAGVGSLGRDELIDTLLTVTEYFRE